MKKLIQKTALLVFVSLLLAACGITKRSCGCFAQTKKILKTTTITSLKADVIVVKKITK
ncbi:MAG: hypothetical protein L3J45_09085 [Flavobacteriaceae bacterium]|nr:hypothetical protein [Flavobacteriaceae bacterium]